MAAFFTLPELRAELHSLGHDDVPDDVIMAFLSQMQITIPSCFDGGRDGEHSNRGSSSAKSLTDEDSEFWKQLDLLERQSKFLDDDGQKTRVRSIPARDRPDTPPRGGPYVLDSDASKENFWSRNSGSAHQHSRHRQSPPRHSSKQLSRRVLRPCDNTVQHGQAKSEREQFIYPGDLLAQLKERHRPCSCPTEARVPSPSVVTRSSSAGVGSSSTESIVFQQAPVYHRRGHRARSREAEAEVSECGGDFSSNSPSRVDGYSKAFSEDENHDSESICSDVDEEAAIEPISVTNLKPLNLGVVKHNSRSDQSKSDDKSPATEGGEPDDLSERPTSIQSHCAACFVLRESKATRFRHFSLNKHREKSPSETDSEEQQREDNPQAALRRRSETKSVTPALLEVPAAHTKKPVMRKGKVDRVARFAEMQKLWKRDHFLRATSNGKRKTQSFHRMFAAIHASNEKEYAAARARSVLGVREEAEHPPFVLTT